MMQDLKLSNNTSKLHQMFGPKLYSDKFSFISEVCQNAVDSHRMAGQKEYVTVGLKRIDSSNCQFYVQDKGLSFKDEEDFISKVCTLLESGKSSEKTNDESCAMGEHGIGSISVSAFVNEWNYEVVTPTKELFYCKFRWIEGRGLTYDLSKKRPTDLEKGVKVFLDFPISMLTQVYGNMTNKLCYFKDIYFEFDSYVKSFIRPSLTINTDFKLFQSDDFQISTLSPYKQMHITLDQYAYRIDWDRLGISPIPYNIALKFGMGDGLKADITRENLQYIDNYKDIILNKLKKVSEWIINKYNNSFPDKITDFKEAMEVYGRINSLQLENITVSLPLFENFSKLKSKKFNYKDIDFTTFFKFARNLNYCLQPSFMVTKGKKYTTGYIKHCDNMYYLDSPLDSLQKAYIGSLNSKSLFCQKRKWSLNNLKNAYNFNILMSTVKAHYVKTGVNLLRVFVEDLTTLQHDYVTTMLLQSSKIEVPKSFVPPAKKPREKVLRDNVVVWRIYKWNKVRKVLKIADIESASKPLICTTSSEGEKYCRRILNCQDSFDFHYITEPEYKRKIEKLKVQNVMTIEEFKEKSPKFVQFVDDLHCIDFLSKSSWLRHYKLMETLNYSKNPLLQKIKGDVSKITSVKHSTTPYDQALISETLPMVSKDTMEMLSRIKKVGTLVELLIPLTTVGESLRPYKLLAFDAIIDKMGDELSRLYDTPTVSEVRG